MNWITKFIKPKIASLFKKKTSETNEVLWTTCQCKNLIYKEDLQNNLNCCPKCGSHHKLSCKERFDTFFDEKDYELLKTPIPKDDPIKFIDKKKIYRSLKICKRDYKPRRCCFYSNRNDK